MTELSFISSFFFGGKFLILAKEKGKECEFREATRNREKVISQKLYWNQLVNFHGIATPFQFRS